MTDTEHHGIYEKENSMYVDTLVEKQALTSNFVLHPMRVH